MTTLYNMRRTPDGYRMVKWDQHLNIEAVYNILYRRGRHYCDCPQGGKGPTCRHRDMIPLFNSRKAIDKGIFYCYETGEWDAHLLKI
jgi:hypothetical protein